MQERVAIYLDQTVATGEFRVRPAALILGPQDPVVRFTNHTDVDVKIEELQDGVTIELKPRKSFLWIVPKVLADGARAYRVRVGPNFKIEAVGDSAPHVIIDRAE